MFSICLVFGGKFGDDRRWIFGGKLWRCHTRRMDTMPSSVFLKDTCFQEGF